MPYYICFTHNVAWPTYSALVGHHNFAHPGEDKPSREEVERDELPEDVELAPPSKRQRRKQQDHPPEGGYPSEGGRGEYMVDELPTEPPDLFYSLLRLKGISDQTARRLQLEFKLSPWMWGDAQEIQSLLRGAKLGVGQDWVRSFLKQYGNTVEIPAEEAGIGFIGSRRPARDEFFGRIEPQTSQDPLTAFLRYQMFKEEKAEERQQRAVDPETEHRLQAMETSNREMMDTQNKLLALLEKQEHEQEKAALDARFARLEALQQQKPAGEEWLPRFLDEREKRHEELIKDMSAKLAAAAQEVSDARGDAKRSRAEAIAEEEDRLEKARRRLEDAGYAPRVKTTEERILDVVQEQIAPAVVSEVKEGRRLMERAMTGAQAAAPPAGSIPVSGDEAQRLATLMEVENQLKRTRL